MSTHRKNKLGNGRITKAINKPISGALGKKRSKSFVFVFGLIASMILWWYASSELGFKAGTVVTLVAVGFVVFQVFEHKLVKEKRSVKFIKEDK